MANLDNEAVWKKESIMRRTALGVAKDVKPWTGRQQFAGTGLPKNERILELLDLFVLDRCHQLGYALTDDLTAIMAGQYIDVSQSYYRYSRTHIRTGLNHALTSGSMIYSFERDSVLVGRELLLLHGQPRTLALPHTPCWGRHGLSMPGCRYLVRLSL